MRLAYATVLLLAGCDMFDPCAGPEYLNFAVVHHGMLADGTPTLGSDAPRWGSTETMKPTDEIEVIFADHHSLPADVLELYAIDGTRQTFAGTDSYVPTNHDACSHNERHYALGGLPIGDYTLVHRRKNGTGDDLNCLDLDCPWVTFQGDTAVTLTLSIR